MNRRYATADVFTERPFGGNPVAVVLDAVGLETAAMQALALEFNYVETTFVLPPRDPANTAEIRIFTPDREIPFAGHPNLGTAFILARQQAARGEPASARLRFEEAAGLVEVELHRHDGVVVGAELLSPQPLGRHATVPPAVAAACLGLPEHDVTVTHHPPQVASVGLPFLFVELLSREALRNARPGRAAYDHLFPLDGARAVYAYTRDTRDGCDLHARMFTWRLIEDPATGSAAAALAALLAETGGGTGASIRVGQGIDMGRPSTLLARARRHGGGTEAFVGGRCVAMFEGSVDL